MLKSYTALIRQSEGWWIGWILEVRGGICQEQTRTTHLRTPPHRPLPLLEPDETRSCNPTDTKRYFSIGVQ